MENNSVIILNNVSKIYHIKDKSDNSIRQKVFNLFSTTHKRSIFALNNVNLEIKKGEFFGIIGRNGSGKSTLINIISNAINPDKGGKVELYGKYIRLSLGMGFDPELTARENIYVNASIMGFSFKQIGRKFKRMIQFAELESFKDTKLKYFSSGMRARLAFSVAINTDADILLMDEFFGGVGDENFRKKSEEVFKKRLLDGRTIVHVSHNLNTIKNYCDRVLLLNEGEVVSIGKPEEVIQAYREVLKT